MTCPKCARDIPDDAILCCYCGKKFQVKRSRRTRPNGMGTAIQRGKTWTSVVVVGWHDKDGHPVPSYATKGGFRTKKDALEYCPTLKG